MADRLPEGPRDEWVGAMADSMCLAAEGQPLSDVEDYTARVYRIKARVAYTALREAMEKKP